MTQEDKELLLKDLCARTPYKVKLKIGEYSDYELIGIVITDEHPIKVEVIENGIPYKIEVSPDIVKPYLRPWSTSMTEEEKKEYEKLFHRNEEGVYICANEEWSDFMHSHHLDYRNLIEKGLALKALEGMYKH